MAYKFKLDEPLDKGVRRVASGQLDRVCDALDSLDAKVFVHEARKSLKRVRALLRLIRHALGKGHWRRLNEELRDTGRLLAGDRDRDVRCETLALLAREAGKGLAGALQRVSALEAVRPPEPSLSISVLAPPVTALRQAVERMHLMRQTLAKLAVEIEAKHLEIGLERTHRAGHRALAAAQAGVKEAGANEANAKQNGANRTGAADEQFHELRKVVQLHWRQMQLLAAAWPELFKARITSARGLARDLGLEHDFAALAQWLEQHAAHVSRQDVRLIVSACQQAQTGLRTTALKDAEILFASRPRDFAREAIAYWTTAVAASATKKVKRDVPSPKRALPASGQRRKAAGNNESIAAPGEGGGGEARVRSRTSRKARTAPAG